MLTRQGQNMMMAMGNLQNRFFQGNTNMLLMTSMQMRGFTGKTEDGFKWRTPKLRLRKVKRIPPPGMNLKIPDDLDPETFCA